MYICGMENIKKYKWIKSDRPLKDYHVGTKAKADGGGHWTKTSLGWKWGLNGGTFPRPGGDWSGEVCLPQICYKTNKQCLYDCSGLCKESC
jgi:hypothetical protein